MFEWTYFLQVFWHFLVVLLLIFGVVFSGVLLLASRSGGSNALDLLTEQPAGS